MKVHCLFEQSGTFKNEFKKLGYDAEDYDILNQFNQTDHIVDLFEQIELGYQGKESIFDEMKQDDLIMAFFPYTRFEAQIIMYFRGVANGYSKWSLEKKLEYSIKLHNELHRNYLLVTKLVIIALKRNLKLVIENPYSPQHYLTRYWAIQPAVIDTDRTFWGDYFEKPTQYFFINCEPKNNLIMDEGLEVVEKRRIESCGHSDKERSIIHPQYARRFIRSYLIDKGEEDESIH